MGLNDELKVYIKSIGVKQSYLCEKTNIPADTVSRILNSKRNLTAEEYMLMCDVLSIDPRMLWRRSKK